MAWSAGLEPATIGLEIRCSIQLSYDQTNGVVSRVAVICKALDV